MNLTPILSYELRRAARRPATYRLRLVSGAVAIGLSCWALLVWENAGPAVGRVLFSALVWMGFTGSALAGLVLTADCISQERRDGTLGLLMLTDLSGFDIALGKLAAKAVAPFYWLLSVFPCLAVCLLFGGVTGPEIGRAAIFMLNIMFFSLSLTLLTSAVCRQKRAAEASGLLALIIFIPGLSMLSQVVASPLGQSVCKLLAPATGGFLVFDAAYQSQPGWFWASTLATHGFGWVCLMLTALILPAIATENRLFQKIARQTTARFSRPKVQSHHPIAWLVSGSPLRLCVVWSMPAAALWVWAGLRPDPFGAGPAQIGFAALFMTHALFKLWVGAASSHEFSTGRYNGTLEMLLSTPLHSREVAAGLFLGYLRRFVAPLMVLLLIDSALAAHFVAFNNRAAAVVVLAAGLMLVMDSYAIFWVGLWRGLVARDSRQAIFSTIARILVFPWLFLGPGLGMVQPNKLAEFAATWVFVGVLTDVMFWIIAREVLQDHFRSMALRPYGEPAPQVHSKWSAINWNES